MLKLVLGKNTSVEDPLLSQVSQAMRKMSYGATTVKMKETFQFLKWKISMNSTTFDCNDLIIVRNNEYSRFEELSPACCSYTKTQMKTFTELMWQNMISVQYQMEGFQTAPKVSCNKLKIPFGVSRELETLLLSLFYPNNLFNGFLYRFNKLVYTTPLCSCKTDVQTPLHILLDCPKVDICKRSTISEILDISSNADYGYITLLDHIRDFSFISSCIEVLEEAKLFLRVDIQLQRTTN